MPHAMVITIDGAAGTGKTTVSRSLARRLGWTCLDTGAMYRAVALIAIEHSIDPTDGETLVQKTRELGLNYDFTVAPPELTIGGAPVGNRIRDLDVGSIVSIVAAQSPVRVMLVDAQRAVAMHHPKLVSEGRDQGSVVFPDAMIRFFLIADTAIRARRRADQLHASGTEVDPHDVAREITNRDRIDSTRSEAPMIVPEGAIVIDSSQRSIDEVVDEMESVVRTTLSGLDQN